MKGCQHGEAIVPTPSDRERFARFVERGPGCWHWTAAVQGKGYGSFWSSRSRRQVLAHRMAFAIAHGGVDGGTVVMHTCDNPSCVRPDHLRAGSQLDNMQDKMTKGRQRYSKLPAECCDCGKPLATRGRCRDCGIKRRAARRRFNPYRGLAQRVSHERLAQQRLIALPFVPPSSFAELVAIAGERPSTVLARHLGIYDFDQVPMKALARELGMSHQGVSSHFQTAVRRISRAVGRQ
jgi:hypothetical protein